jgi:hypothetical protein
MIDINIAVFAMKEWFRSKMKQLHIWALMKGIK